MSEVWDPVFWNPVLSNLKYEVSNHGEVREAENGRILSTHEYGGRPGDHYLGVNLDGVKWYLHRLVLANFLANPLNKRGVNHKNGDKKDCRLSNLEWATQSENVLHAVLNGLRTYESMTKPVRQLTQDGQEIATYASPSEAARMTNCSRTGIAQVAAARLLTCGGFKWEFVRDEHRPMRAFQSKHIGKRIRQLTMAGVVVADHENASEASRATNVNIGNMCNAARGGVRSAGGYMWQYID
jgi:HNH endonuclease